MKRFFNYLGWTIAIGIIIFLGARYQLQLEEKASETFNLTSTVLFISIFPFIIGILLRLPKLINEIQEQKPWTFDWIKFIAIGLPSLFLILFLNVFIFLLPGKIPTLIPLAKFIGNPTIYTIAGVVLGYVLLDSLKK